MRYEWKQARHGLRLPPEGRAGPAPKKSKKEMIDHFILYLS
jgi:hypothetical protein